MRTYSDLSNTSHVLSYSQSYHGDVPRITAVWVGCVRDTQLENGCGQCGYILHADRDRRDRDGDRESVPVVASAAIVERDTDGCCKPIAVPSGYNTTETATGSSIRVVSVENRMLYISIYYDIPNYSIYSFIYVTILL